MSKCEITIENGIPVVKTYPRLMQDLLAFTDFDIIRSLDLYGVALLDEFQEMGIKNPTINNILGYIEQDYVNSSGELTLENKQLLLDLSLQSTEYADDIREEFLKVFTVDNKFGLNTEALSTSPLFSETDIFDFQKYSAKFKDLYYKLVDTDTGDNNNIKKIPNRYLIKTDAITNQNPDDFEHDLQQKYAGSRSEQEILDKAQSIGDQVVLNNTSLIPMILEDVISKQQLVQYETDEHEGDIIKKTKNSISIELEQTLDTQQDYTQLVSILEFVMGNPNTEYIGQVEEYSASMGLNLLGLQDRSTEKPLEETIDFMNSLYNMLYDIQTGLENPQESIIEYSESYNNYFQIEPEFSEKTVGKLQNDGVYLHLETNRSEEELFEKNGLLKVQENIYRKLSTEEDSLESLYNTLIENSALLPKGVYTVPLKKSNQDMILEDLDQYVSGLAKEYLRENSNIETLKKLVAYKILTGTKVQPNSKVFNGPLNINTDDFLTSFNKFILRNPDIKSMFYYSNRGLEARKTIGEYTARKLENTLPRSVFQDLVAYAKLSGNESLSQLTTFENEYQPIEQRNFLANNLDQLPVHESEYQKQNGYLVTSSNEDYIRVQNELYENVAPNVYAKVERDSRYTNHDLEKPYYDNSVEPEIKSREKGKIQVTKTNEINNNEIEFC